MGGKMGRLLISVLVPLLLAPVAHAQDDDLYAELDEFAAAHLDSIQPTSFAENVEFCGYYGLDADQQIVASPPTRGERDSCFPADPQAEMVEILASYHTHGAYTMEADIEVPSPDDLIGDIDEGIDGYIATPGGRLWLNNAAEEVAVQLCGPGCITADPAFRECSAFMPGEEYTLDGLQQRGEDDPGTC
jgi:hypothetical protein